MKQENEANYLQRIFPSPFPILAKLIPMIGRKTHNLSEYLFVKFLRSFKTHFFTILLEMKNFANVKINKNNDNWLLSNRTHDIIAFQIH